MQKKVFKNLPKKLKIKHPASKLTKTGTKSLSRQKNQFISENCVESRS